MSDLSEREATLPLPEANLYAHELLSNGGGIWLACSSEAILRQTHDPDETGDEVRALYTADQMRAYRAALPVQQGWQLVPTTPTPEMLDAASKLLMTPLDGMARAGIKGPYGVYRAMLAASPQPKEAP
jgi:hypothetical protein